jgi:PIN domain nuclease of toxin-antitoxin system
VVEVSAAVVDTHPLVFHAAGGKLLGKRAAALFRACEDQRAIAYVPTVVIWEMSLLARTRRIDVGGSFRSFFTALFSNPAYQPLELSLEQVLLADEVRPNDDPFDALICAAALTLELPLVTRDADIQASGIVQILWA